MDATSRWNRVFAVTRTLTARTTLWGHRASSLLAESQFVPAAAIGVSLVVCGQMIQAAWGSLEPWRSLALSAAVFGLCLSRLLPLWSRRSGLALFLTGVAVWLTQLWQWFATRIPDVVPEAWLQNSVSLCLVQGAVALIVVTPGTAFAGWACRELARHRSSWWGSAGWLATATGCGMIFATLVLTLGANPTIVLGLAGMVLGMIGVWRLFGPGSGQSHAALPLTFRGPAVAVSMPQIVLSTTAIIAAGVCAGMLAWSGDRILRDRIPAASFQLAAAMCGWLWGFALTRFSPWSLFAGHRFFPSRTPKTSGERYVPNAVPLAAAGILACLAGATLGGLDLLILNINAWISVPLVVLMLRFLLALLFALPTGILVGSVLPARHVAPPASGLVVVSSLLCGGLAAPWLLRDWLNVTGIWSAAALGVCLLGICVCLREYFAHRDIRTWIPGAVTCGLAGLAMLCAPANDVRWESKSLFSTSAFVAHRAGLPRELLPSLDDSRLIAVSTSPNATYTLWKQRSVEYSIRAGGVPVGSYTSDSRVTPQAMPELLQTVVPLVLHDHPESLLVLGIGSGTTIATASDFPLQEIVCQEGDETARDWFFDFAAPRMSLDPAADDRLMIQSVDPVWGVAAQGPKYDVILSCPPVASLDRAAACFTVDHYHRIAARLEEDGIFCQRYECIDFGPRPFATITHTLRSAFREVTFIETAAGEGLFLATNSPRGLMRAGLLDRVQSPQVRRTLGRAGWDWSLIVNLPAYDDTALDEISREICPRINSIRNNTLAWTLPHETMKWTPKLQQVQSYLVKVRTSEPRYERYVPSEAPEIAAKGPVLRKSRFIEWIGEDGMNPHLLHRLSEVAAQMNLFRDNPDAWWWEYRKTIKEQLRKEPPANIRLTSASTLVNGMLPTYAHRKDFLETVGDAVKMGTPTDAALARVEQFNEPYDPLLQPFMHQEAADLYHRAGDRFAGDELLHRLHLVYFAPGSDRSIRHVHAALEVALDHPDSLREPTDRFDVLNGLMMNLAQRWQQRAPMPVKSARVALRDVETSLQLARRATESMDELARQGAVDPRQWDARKQVLTTMLVRPLETYRASLQEARDQSVLRTQTALQQGIVPRP